MIFIDIIALIGGCLLSVCLVPQIYKVYESKNSDNISLSWQALYFIGLVPHLAYGIYLCCPVLRLEGLSVLLAWHRSS